jgi:hypothetical protein
MKKLRYFVKQTKKKCLKLFSQMITSLKMIALLAQFEQKHLEIIIQLQGL